MTPRSARTACARRSPPTWPRTSNLSEFFGGWGCVSNKASLNLQRVSCPGVDHRPHRQERVISEQRLEFFGGCGCVSNKASLNLQWASDDHRPHRQERVNCLSSSKFGGVLTIKRLLIFSECLVQSLPTSPRTSNFRTTSKFFGGRGVCVSNKASLNLH